MIKICRIIFGGDDTLFLRGYDGTILLRGDGTIFLKGGGTIFLKGHGTIILGSEDGNMFLGVMFLYF